MAPRLLVLDAGPLIALFHQHDPDHGTAVHGFETLATTQAELVIPAPVVFEVYKWLLYHSEYAIAQLGLREMRATLEITYMTADEFNLVCQIAESLPGWTGTLEDAIVALTALRVRSPVWTLNYRDLSAFPRLTFWNP
jgi:predicted nucleic acid-binding protein